MQEIRIRHVFFKHIDNRGERDRNQADVNIRFEAMTSINTVDLQTLFSC